MAYTTLKSGSSGSDVKKLQNALISAGYSVGSSGADGIYGNATAKAVQAYQKANGLSVDGIAGNNTLSKLYGNSTSGTKASTNTSPKSTINNKWSDIDLSKYEGGFTGNAATNYAESQKNNAENALNTYGSYESKYDQYLNETLDSILNREEFSYDLNGDALYQQYKDKYMTQGKLAMMDTMGQAAAMTGGYGNSYASTAGNQAYQSHLQQLNDIVPELYQLALDKYNMEGDALRNQYSILSDAENRAYSKWADEYNRLADNRDYYNNNYFNVYSQESDTFYNNYNMDSAEYWNAYNAGYGAEQDAIANAMAEKQYQLELNKYNESVRAAKAREASEAAALQEQIRQYNESLAEQKRKNNLDYLLEKSKKTSNDGAETGDNYSYTTENISPLAESMRASLSNKTSTQKQAAVKEWLNSGKITKIEASYILDYYGI